MPRGLHNNHAKADRQHRWNGDRKIMASSGHVKVRVGRAHPLADPNGYAYEHLLVWVAAGNPRPPRGFLLHHKNEVKSDNRLENLELMQRGDHNKMHNAEKGRDPITGRILGKKAAGALLDGREWRQFPDTDPPSSSPVPPGEGEGQGEGAASDGDAA
jgi:hypothetical protein